MLFSIIIITYNSASLIRDCLDSLLQTSDAQYELIVVDNASSDATLQVVREHYPSVRLIANPANVGFGAACNLGIAAAQGDIFISMNPDVQVLPDWLHQLERHFKQHPTTAIICPTTLKHGQIRPTRDDTALTGAVPGCALALRRTAWQSIGGYDPAMFLYWEDTELCWRAWLLGWQVREDFAACVYHEKGASTGNQRWDIETTKNSLYTYLKLRRWRWVLPYALRMLAKTIVYSLRWRNLALFKSWLWNLRHLAQTLRERRHVLARQQGDVAQIEALIAQHLARGKRERRS